MQIFHPFGPIVSGLSCGVTNSFQHRSSGRIDGQGDQVGEERGLIEAALAFPRGMKRNGHNDVETTTVETGIDETFRKPGRNRKAQVALTAILELVKNTADEAAAPVRCDRAIEMQGSMFAVCAAERLRNRAGKWFGTFRAKRRGNAGRETLALGAQVLTRFDGRGTNNAGWRVQKRRGRGNDFRQSAR